MKNKTSIIKLVDVSTNETGQRVDNFLRTKLKSVPKSIIYRILRKGEVRVNGKRIKPKYKLSIGDKVRIPLMCVSKNKNYIISSPLYMQKIEMLKKDILYEDDYILVLNKPSGMAVHGGSGLNFGIIEGLRILYQDSNDNFLELVHRLDRDTSGALLIAKKISALRLLHKQLRERKIRKEYLALVRGQWKSHIKKIQVPLLKNVLQRGERIMQINQNGKISETYFKIEEFYKFATLIRCSPTTGRTHQIRVHTKYIGHPIAFDKYYGDREFDKKLIYTGLTHLFLHAETLKFIHPNTGKIFCIKAPLKRQLEHCLEILRR